MTVHWAQDLHDSEGDAYLKGIFLFIDGDRTILGFKDIKELNVFAKQILYIIEEIEGEQ